MDDLDDESTQVREVYARYGLAVYYAQVLEHGLVNALVVLDLIPTRRHLMQSSRDWESNFDDFMESSFRETMGRLLKRLAEVTTVTPELQELLRESLRKRNSLVHHFFRERSTEFFSCTGRLQMLQEVDECQELFKLTDQHLEQVVGPIRNKLGVTDSMLDQRYDEMILAAKRHDAPTL